MATIAVNITIEDDKYKTSIVTVRIPVSKVGDAAKGFAQALATAVNNLTKGKIIKLAYTVDVDLPGGLRSTAITDSDVEEGATFTFVTDAGFKTSVRLPTYSESFLLAHSRLIDETATEVAAFIDLMVDGDSYAVSAVSAGTSAVDPVDSHADDIALFSAGKEVFTRSRA
ncbi:MAG: hypothetical protein [Circular genetic element sp.]|nr:MAG: hypothetical protein [Circular genetic element sp.]